ncbi:MAG TPA: DNA methyltransferase [Terriglobales bacterium]|nr:DNA methyltransferase [Terriglobales bacterium]
MGKTANRESHLQIQYCPIATLKANPENPRVHSDRQIRQIARSLETFGSIVPVLIDQNSRVIAGHGRILAARLLGLTEFPTIRVEHLTDAQIKAFAIADNKLSENSTWDAALLGQQLKALAEVELDFNLEATGFEMGEIDLLIEGLEPTSEAESDAADSIPDQTTTRVTSVNDLWHLAKHRVLCGNALDPEAYSRLMGKRQAGVVFTDPPYNVPIDGHVSGLGKKRHPNFPMASGEMSESEFTDFLSCVCKHMAGYSRVGSIHFICMDWRHLGELLSAGKEAYDEFKNLCVWAKANAGMGSMYRSQHELVLVFKHGVSPHRNNIQLGQFGRYRTNVWHYPGANSFSRSTEEGNLLELHPTVKPTRLVADAIVDCSARGDIVLDPFLGSGTTVIAAERTGRICYGIELDPAYVDVVVRRWQAFTGLSAKHAGSGRTFNELEKEGGDEHRQ